MNRIQSVLFGTHNRNWGRILRPCIGSYSNDVSSPFCTASLKPIGYTWSYLACRIGDCVPIWQVVLNNLYRHTALQSRFSCNMVALVAGRPEPLSLKDFLRHFLDFRCSVVRRRAQFDHDRAAQRLHLVQGFRKALQDLDEVCVQGSRVWACDNAGHGRGCASVGGRRCVIDR
jgi:DNA gyrase/topoisomerase IV, subunit A